MGRRVVLQIKKQQVTASKPGGVHIVLMGTHHEFPLVVLGYRYSTKTRIFCFHKGCRFNDQGFTI